MGLGVGAGLGLGLVQGLEQRDSADQTARHAFTLDRCGGEEQPLKKVHEGEDGGKPRIRVRVRVRVRVRDRKSVRVRVRVRG